jgi:hypothetical protein
MDRGQRIALGVGGGLTLLGVGGLALRWYSSQKQLPPPTDFRPPYGWQPGFKMPMDPHAFYASAVSFDEADFGGGWILRDVRGARDPNFNPDTDAHIGMTASLVLTYGAGGVPKRFDVKIFQISGDDYQGQWLTQPPAGSGVQLPEFRGAHIFTLHK